MLLKWKIKIKRKWNLEWEIFFFLLLNALTFFNEKKEGFFLLKIYENKKKKIKEIIFKNKTVQLEIDPINNKLQ